MSFFARPPWWQALRKTGQVVTLVSASAVAIFSAGSVQAKVSPPQARETVSMAQLPAAAQTTYRLILTGGPFSSHKDGSVFGNRERALPRKPRGFYHEYTVPTPGARDRGARRIVCGGNARTKPESCFYTADHYSTFQRIAP